MIKKTNEIGHVEGCKCVCCRNVNWPAQRRARAASHFSPSEWLEPLALRFERRILDLDSKNASGDIYISGKAAGLTEALRTLRSHMESGYNKCIEFVVGPADNAGHPALAVAERIAQDAVEQAWRSVNRRIISFTSFEQAVKPKIIEAILSALDQQHQWKALTQPDTPARKAARLNAKLLRQRDTQ